MKCLITGASGFLGSEIINFLDFDFFTLGRNSKSDYCLNLANSIPNFVESFELIVHAAGKAHSVPKTEQEKNEFFNINLNGTKNLLKGIDKLTKKPKTFIFISSVSVYGKTEGLEISEETSLLANDAYGKSKILAEKAILEWGIKNKINIIILRLPLVIGENPPGNLGAMIKFIKKGFFFYFNKGYAKRSMVLARDVAKLIPNILNKNGIYNLTDNYHPSFLKLTKVLKAKYNKHAKVFNVPLFLGVILAKSGDLIEKLTKKSFPINSKKLNQLSSSLTFSSKKATRELNWNPTNILAYYEFN